MDDFNQIKTEITLAESQYTSFKDKKTKVSCTRCRAHLLSIKKLCDKMRRDILNAQKAQKGEKKEDEKKTQSPTITTCTLKRVELESEVIVIPDDLEMPVLTRENTVMIDEVVTPLVHIAKKKPRKTRKPRVVRKA